MIFSGATILGEIPPANCVMVLGRGIDHDGRLTDTARERSEIAVHLARIMDAHLIFTGGRSWRQVEAGFSPPSEGIGMFNHAVEYGGEPVSGTDYNVEETSESTTANLTNSYEMVMDSGPHLAILSDELHFAYRRPQYLARKIFPSVAVTALSIPRAYTQEDLKQEFQTTVATRAALALARRGDIPAINAAQKRLERANSWLRQRTGFSPQDGELPPDTTSYRLAPSYARVTTAEMAGILLGQIA